MAPCRLYTRVALAGLGSAVLATAFAAHAILEIAQSTRLLGGDYGHHRHDAVLPVGLAAGSVLLCGLLMYVAHLAEIDGNSLPSLARALGKGIGWRSIVISATGACVVLIAMESAEQLASGRFDGIASAFGGVPLIGIGLIVLIGSMFNTLARAFCGWLINTHARLIFVVALLLQSWRSGAVVTGRQAKRSALATFDYTWDSSQAHGKRAPPLLVS